MAPAARSFSRAFFSLVVGLSVGRGRMGRLIGEEG